MRSKLSYYSVLLLVGLGVVSVIVLTMNPFNGAPARASPAARNAATTSIGSGNAHSAPNSQPISGPSGNGLQVGGGFGEEHHQDSDGLSGEEGAAGNSTTTTMTTAGVYSQNE